VDPATQTRQGPQSHMRTAQTGDVKRLAEATVWEAVLFWMGVVSTAGLLTIGLNAPRLVEVRTAEQNVALLERQIGKLQRDFQRLKAVLRALKEDPDLLRRFVEWELKGRPERGSEPPVLQFDPEPTPGTGLSVPQHRLRTYLELCGTDPWIPRLLLAAWAVLTVILLVWFVSGPRPLSTSKTP
jgi:hypothetical protein